MQLFLYRKSRKALFGSSSEASVPDLRLRKSEKMPSSNFLAFLTGRPKAWKRNAKHRTMSVPVMWKRLFHRMQETYSPVGRRKRLMYWSCAQSTGAEMRKYLTVLVSVEIITWLQIGQVRLTIVHLLQGYNRVWW